jgi:predicted acylesterase/phospholipase RssA
MKDVPSLAQATAVDPISQKGSKITRGNYLKLAFIISTFIMSNQDMSYRQRALVLQGGGALGAYEAGALKVLCKKLIEDTKNEQKNEPLFHIVTGTSIGAMNAAVLVSNVVNRKKTWDEAVNQLEDFWINEKEGLSSTPDFSKWWRNDVNDQDKNTTTGIRIS